ncbi:MAG: ABC transporter permease [Bacteroidota bacterium]
MRKYVLKRVLWFFPTMFAVSLLAFMISSWSPEDPVDGSCPNLSDPGATPENIQRCITREREKFGLHLPLFYIEFGSLTSPDTLYKIYPKSTRNAMERISHRTGNWDAVNAYHLSLKQLSDQLVLLELDSANLGSWSAFDAKIRLQDLQLLCKNLLSLHQEDFVVLYLNRVDSMSLEAPFLHSVRPTVQKVHAQWQSLQAHPQSWKRLIPKLIIHGWKNQYHRWISKILLDGDFGRSFRNEDRVSDKISRAFWISFSLPVLSIFLAYLIALPLGIYAAMNANGWWDKLSGGLMWLLDALPTFWVMTMLLVWLGYYLGWVPVVFDASITDWGKYLHQLLLPLLGYTYGSLAVLSRTMRSGILEVIRQDYMRTARAKGLSQWAAVKKHAIQNALTPLIIMFVGIFPAMIGGSVIIEAVFGIPGMGYEILEATRENDMPMVVTIFTLSGFLTALGYLVADLLNAWVDPRIRLGKKQTDG